MSGRPHDLTPEGHRAFNDTLANGYCELEGLVADVKFSVIVAGQIVTDLLTPTEKLLPQHVGYEAFLLTREQWATIDFAIGEAEGKARDLEEAYARAWGRAETAGGVA